MGVWKRFGGVIERHGHKIALAVGRGLVKAIPVLGSVIDEVFKLGEMEDQRVPIRRIENDLERLLGGLDQRVLARIPNASIDDLGDGFARAIRDLPEEDRKAIVVAAVALAAKQGGERLHRGAVLRERILRALARGDRFRHSLVSALHARKGEERFFEPGERINGRFLVVEMIGFGGMGTVYRVQDELVGDPRALKVIAPSLLANPDLRKRFIQEARVALALNHPNIVRAMHIDEARTTLDAPASLFILMELVSGASLRDFLKTRRRLGWEEARSLAGQILEGFAHAHAARVFHLDVKPENIMVDRAGRAKIIDFGLARAMGLDTAATPLAGMGTPYYMAPEQRDGGSRPDHRADLFSIAVVLYEMLTGSLPFGVVRRVEEVNPETPPGLHDVLLRSMAEHPEDRHPDAAAFKDALWLLGRSPETKARRRDGTPLVPAGGGVAPRPGAGAGAGAGPGAG
ncbi:MAG: serine/threonine protein kinase, partial [Planctomycetes bacterium]|nr:serine/threonine protein kinase [Planctomycetota bacterium]